MEQFNKEFWKNLICEQVLENCVALKGAQIFEAASNQQLEQKIFIGVSIPDLITSQNNKELAIEQIKQAVNGLCGAVTERIGDKQNIIFLFNIHKLEVLHAQASFDSILRALFTFQVFRIEAENAR